MPGVNGIGHNNYQPQVNGENPGAENVNQPQAPAHRSRLAQAGWTALGVATLGISALVRYSVQKHQVAKRNLQPQIPALSAADRRANDDLASRIRRDALTEKLQQRVRSALAELRRKLPAVEVTEAVREAWASRIEKCCTGKVSSREAADFLKDIVRGEYLKHNVVNHLVEAQAAQLAVDQVPLDEATLRNLTKVISGSPQVLKLAAHVNFKAPAEAEAFRTRLRPLVAEEVTLVLSAVRKIDAAAEESVAKVARLAGQPLNEALRESAQPAVDKLKKTMRQIVNNFPRDPKTWLLKVSSLPELTAQIEAAARDFVEEREAVIVGLRSAGLSNALQAQWMQDVFDEDVFMSPDSAPLYASIARNLADGMDVARLAELLRDEAPQAAAVKECLEHLLQTLRTRLADGVDRASWDRVDGNAFISICRNVFAMVYEKKPELARLFVEKREVMADLVEAMLASGDRREVLFAQSVFHAPETRAIETLVQERTEARADAGRRAALMRALAGDAVEFPEVARAREALAAVFGPAILEGVNAGAGLRFDGREEAGVKDALRELVESGARLRPGAAAERYKAVVVENYVTRLLAATAPAAAEPGADFTPSLRALARHPAVKARLAQLATPEDVTRLGTELSPVIRDFITAEKRLAALAAPLYDGLVSHLAQQSGVTEAEVRRSVTQAAFTQRLLATFETAPDLNFTDAAEAAAAAFAEEVKAIDSAWDERFAAIDAAPVTDEVKAAWRREAVLANAFAHPADVERVVAAAGDLNTRSLETVLAQADNLTPKEVATLVRGEMHRISEVLMRHVGRGNVSREEADGLRTALVTLLYSRSNHRLPQLLADHREAIFPAVFALDEEAMKVSLDAEFSEQPPERAARAKALEMENVRRCHVLWSPLHPKMADFAATLEQDRDNRRQDAIIRHNRELGEMFKSDPLPADLQASVDAMTAGLREQFGDVIAPEGRLDAFEHDLRMFYDGGFGASAEALTVERCVELLRRRLILAYLRETVVAPVVRDIAKHRNIETANVTGLCSRIVSSERFMTLADGVVNQDVAALRDVARQMTMGELRSKERFEKKVRELTQRYITKLAYELEMDVEDVRSMSDQPLLELTGKIFERSFNRLSRNPATGLVDEANLTALFERMEKDCDEAIARKLAVLEKVRSSDLPASLKAQWRTQVLDSVAFFSPDVVTASILAGRAAAASEEVRRLVEALSAEGPLDVEAVKSLMTSVMEKIVTTVIGSLSPKDAVAVLDCECHGPVMVQAMAVLYAACPSLAAAVNRVPQRLVPVIEALEGDFYSDNALHAAAYFLQPDAVRPAHDAFCQLRQAVTSEHLRNQMRQAIDGEADIPFQYCEAFDDAVRALRQRFGTALAPEGVTAVTMPYAREALAAIRAQLDHYVSGKELSALFVEKVTQTYLESQLLPAIARSVAAEEGIAATDDDIATTVRLALAHSRSVHTILGALQKAEDLDEAEFMLRPVLRRALDQLPALTQQRDAVLLATRQTIAAAAEVPLQSVEGVDLSSVEEAMAMDGEGVSLDEETGLPDLKGAARLKVRGESAMNAQMDGWRMVFESINRLPQLSDELKSAWRREALSNALFQNPARVASLERVAGRIPDGLSRALDVYPWRVADFIDGLKTMDLEMAQAFAEDSAWVGADEDTRRLARQHMLSAYLDENRAVLGKLKARRDVVIEAFRSILSGAVETVDADEAQRLVHLLDSPALADIRRAVYDENRPAGWDFLERGEYRNEPLAI